jgi:hypothetical protein
MGNANLQIIQDGPWTAGVDSLLYPTDLVQGSYAWGVNIVNRGGVVQTRPSKRRVASFCGHRAQGVFWVRTIDDWNYLLVAIDGAVYWSPFPFVQWKQITGASFRADAERIWFCNAIQATYYDASNNLALLPDPKNVVIMQDGVSTPCYWDTSDYSSGAINYHTVTGFPAAPMPVGTAMIWQDNRLWLAVDELVYASDLLYPQSFNENVYLSGQTGFRFPRRVVNLWAMPVQGLLVLTDSSMHSLQSYIQKREDWQTTEGFQQDVNLEIGLIAPWAIANLHGMPWILTARGIISYDRALTTNLTTVLLTADGEMQRSKYMLSPDITNAAMGYWENVLLVAVPASAIKNRHTWIMDAGIAEKLNNTVGMCWSGIWTGTYPVQFVSPIVSGTQHNYELAYSSGFLALNQGDSPSPQPETDLPLQAYIHLFENVLPQPINDVEEPIWCSFETKAYSLATDDYYRFVFAEIMLVNLYGTVPVQVYMTGLAGNYQQLFKTTLRADKGPFGNPDHTTKLYYVANGKTTEFQNYRRQVRHMRTSEHIVNETPDAAACSEISRPGGIDKAFQLMIRWQGRLGIRQIKFFYDRQLQSPQGVCPTDESTTPHIVFDTVPDEQAA